MFRTFVACAMLGDKAVNDSNYSTKTWCCLTRLPVAILNATEMFILKTLRWNATMSDIQWDEMLAYLRAHIKTGGDFDPFGYDEDSPSGMMARMLDAWISMSQPAAPVTVDAIQSPMEIHAPQPIRPIPQFRLVDADEWCPEDDPIVSLKPRTVGVAPGADRRENELKAGTTAKDLLDSILGSTASADLAYMRRTTGTSFYGSFGAFGLRLANLAGTLQNPSWFPAQG
ncbi:hypothetical protein HYDPIDRAFT_78670 [Hydnomerulius pinastri MD-312]|nr:hypothetical protein HYDPIDRAFT_78670 [Hydnomerulius pinastri MD-312]